MKIECKHVCRVTELDQNRFAAGACFVVPIIKYYHIYMYV